LIDRTQHRDAITAPRNTISHGAQKIEFMLHHRFGEGIIAEYESVLL